MATPSVIAFLRLIEEEHPEALTADGFDDAIIGICRRCGQPPVMAYDSNACIRILVERDDMTREDAEEFFWFNVAGAWVGPGTPVFVQTSVVGE
jgi:hypothetical protein